MAGAARGGVRGARCPRREARRDRPQVTPRWGRPGFPPSILTLRRLRSWHLVASPSLAKPQEDGSRSDSDRLAAARRCAARAAWVNNAWVKAGTWERGGRHTGHPHSCRALCFLATAPLVVRAPDAARPSMSSVNVP